MFKKPTNSDDNKNDLPPPTASSSTTINHQKLKPNPKTTTTTSTTSTTTITLNSDHLNNLKSKPRYRNSISTESPIVMLTPPNPDDIVREERRLSIGSNVSHNSTISNNSPKSNNLIPPDPEEIVNKLILQRRASTITTLSAVFKQIFTDKKIREDGIPALIINNLYLGSIGAAKNISWLKSNNITHILCVAGGIGECFPKQFIYKVIDINDAPDEDISFYFNESYNFIESCLKSNGKILVHCFAGMSRSVTVVSAYLMKKQQILAVPALKYVKEKRIVANPNAGFIVQLIKYQKVLGLKKHKNDNNNIIITSDNDNDNDEEEKADKPTKNIKISSLKALAAVLKQNKVKKDKNKIHLNPQIKEWEKGRRPSLFTALAKLRALKSRTRASSNASNISDMSTNKDKDVADVAVTAPALAIDPLDALNKANLDLLKEVSNETDKSDNLGNLNNNVSSNSFKALIAKHVALDINNNNKNSDDDDDDDDMITPLEDLNNDPFPDIDNNNNNSKTVNILSTTTV